MLKFRYHEYIAIFFWLSVLVTSLHFALWGQLGELGEFWLTMALLFICYEFFCGLIEGLSDTLKKPDWAISYNEKGRKTREEINNAELYLAYLKDEKEQVKKKCR